MSRDFPTGWVFDAADLTKLHQQLFAAQLPFQKLLSCHQQINKRNAHKK